MKAVIIEDEERSRIVLQSLIETYSPEIQIVGDADSVNTGLKLIKQVDPELIFMDIRIIGGTGFDILERLDNPSAGVVFTTAYDQYALKAFKFSAIDYLLKPIDVEELKNAVKRALNSQDKWLNNQKIESLLSNIKSGHEKNPIMLVSTMDTVEFINIKEIIHIKAEGAYSTIYKQDGSQLTASKVIKEYEHLLNDHFFYRVHQSHLINVRFIDKFLKRHQCFLMTDGTKIQLARSRKEDFFALINQYQ